NCVERQRWPDRSGQNKPRRSHGPHDRHVVRRVRARRDERLRASPFLDGRIVLEDHRNEDRYDDPVGREEEQEDEEVQEGEEGERQRVDVQRDEDGYEDGYDVTEVISNAAIASHHGPATALVAGPF